MKIFIKQKEGWKILKGCIGYDRPTDHSFAFDYSEKDNNIQIEIRPSLMELKHFIKDLNRLCEKLEIDGEEL